jgi:hypothetical protein
MPTALDGNGYSPLMQSAIAGHPARQYLAPFGDEPSKQFLILIVYLLHSPFAETTTSFPAR